MGAIFNFYVINKEQKREYDNMLKTHIEDYELQEWLEQNTIIKDVKLSISYSSMGDLTEWLVENSKKLYSPDEDIFYEIDKSECAKETFSNLYWVEKNRIKSHDVWCDNTFLIVQRIY